jgi:hypothetical protein
MTAATKTSLRDTLLSALQDARMWREDKYGYCDDCRKATTNVCLDHEDDDALAGQYETAKAAIESGDAAKVAALLAGTERAA